MAGHPGNPYHDKLGRFTSGTYGAAGTKAKAGGSSNAKSRGAAGHNAGKGNRVVADHIKKEHTFDKVQSMHWGEHVADPSYAAHKEKQGWQSVLGPGNRQFPQRARGSNVVSRGQKKLLQGEKGRAHLNQRFASGPNGFSGAGMLRSTHGQSGIDE